VFLLLPIVYPLFAAVRFLVLTPLGVLSQRLDRVVWAHASSLYVMNESYCREYDAAALAPSRWVQEIACGAWAWLVAIGLTTGLLSWATIGKTYLVFLFWITVNQVRTLVAHRYANQGDAPLTHLDQLLDTNTFPRGRWLPELWAPVGLRYHALHHLLPVLPYHSMADAHARLMKQLPPGSPYHRTVRAGLWPALIATLVDRERHAGYQYPIPARDRQASR
jgi:fatty acid desaturase